MAQQKIPVKQIYRNLKRNILSILMIIGCFNAVICAQAVDNPAESAQKYYVTDIPSLGGTFVVGNSINNRGWVSGYSNLEGDGSMHAVLWRHGMALDLKTLGGPNSSILWPVKSNRGFVVGISQTSKPEPNNEAWSCSAFFPDATGTGYTCLGFVWENDEMKPLDTLGGNNGFAAGANEWGQIVGWAETSVHDSTCVAPQVLQFKAAVWEGRNYRVRDLPLIYGDTSSAATAINNRGQIVGISGICDQAVGRKTARHAVLWENGRVIKLGNLGNETWNTPMAINEKGDIVGFASVDDSNINTPVLHAFLWTRSGGMRDLGTLPGDTKSQALGINNRGQIVGFSYGGTNGRRAFIFENGVMKNLNDYKMPDHNGKLEIAGDINDFGEISGRASYTNPETNATYKKPFVATPTNTRK